MLDICLWWDMETKPFVKPKTLTCRGGTEAETKPSEQYFPLDSPLQPDAGALSGGLPDSLCFSQHCV